MSAPLCETTSSPAMARDLRFKSKEVRLRVQGLGFRDTLHPEPETRVCGFLPRVWGLGFRLRHSHLGLGLRGFRVQSALPVLVQLPSQANQGVDTHTKLPKGKVAFFVNRVTVHLLGLFGGPSRICAELSFCNWPAATPPGRTLAHNLLVSKRLVSPG